MDLKTPGREADGEDSKLYTKKDYVNKKEGAGEENKYAVIAATCLEGLGGKENIEDVTNCATRLRVSVKDKNLVKESGYFTSNGAHGLVVNGNAIQVIIGLKVPSVREEFEKLL